MNLRDGSATRTMRLVAIVSGRVQGVSFRAFVAGHAERLGVSGYARNLPGGTVEVVAEGDREQLESLLGYVGEGPSQARVEGLEVTWSEPRNDLQSFTTL